MKSSFFTDKIVSYESGEKIVEVDNFYYIHHKLHDSIRPVQAIYLLTISKMRLPRTSLHKGRTFAEGMSSVIDGEASKLLWIVAW